MRPGSLRDAFRVRFDIDVVPRGTVRRFELKQRRWELEMEIAGPQALGWEGEGYTDDELANTRHWLRSRANTIEGGTSEIQLNIIATGVLGLPRS